ncbi:unnamed protein product [Penicillium olsonii]|nr:unnamed protein product [Penicillium olsonii]
MHILITGAAGFIGQLLAKELLNDPAYRVTLTDINQPPIPAGVRYPQNATATQADLLTGAADVVDASLDAVYAFHGIMSSGSEANFDLGMSVNIDATRNLLEALRHTCPGVRVIYSSSQAVYGQPLPEIVTDSVIPTPESSYGAEKIVCETLVNEYTRRGFITGFTLRFPTISVRPGAPTAAASSFLSGMIREPLDGKPCVIPIEDRGFKSWLCSPKVLVENLLITLRLAADSVPRHIRQINVPGICVTVQGMMDALEAVGGKEKLALLSEKEDPSVVPILRSWPTQFDNTQAISLGFKRDVSFEQTTKTNPTGMSPTNLEHPTVGKLPRLEHQLNMAQLSILVYKGVPVDFSQYRHTALHTSWHETEDWFHVVGAHPFFQFQKDPQNPISESPIARIPVCAIPESVSKATFYLACMGTPVRNGSGDRDWNCQNWVGEALTELVKIGCVTEQDRVMAIGKMVEVILDAEMDVSVLLHGEKERLIDLG